MFKGKIKLFVFNLLRKSLVVYKLSCFGYKSLDMFFVFKSVICLFYFNVNIVLIKFVDNKWLKK